MIKNKDKFILVFISFLVLPLYLFSDNLIIINKNNKKIIEKKFGKSAILRVNDFNEKFKKWKKFTKDEQLVYVNYYVNGIVGQYDAYTSKKEEYWATPKEFLFRGAGDCEDYVSLKYLTFKALGFNKNNLYYAAVKEKYEGGYHMVLLHVEKNSEPMVLDNLSSKVLSLKRRKDLELLYAFNEKGVCNIDFDGKIVPINKTEPRFKDLLLRIKKGK